MRWSTRNDSKHYTKFLGLYCSCYLRRLGYKDPGIQVTAIFLEFVLKSFPLTLQENTDVIKQNGKPIKLIGELSRANQLQVTVI